MNTELKHDIYIDWEYIRLFAKIGDWYIVQTDNDYIGAVSSKYIKLIYPNTRKCWE